jgi:hypothetical protein
MSWLRCSAYCGLRIRNRDSPQHGRVPLKPSPIGCPTPHVTGDGTCVFGVGARGPSWVLRPGTSFALA